MDYKKLYDRFIQSRIGRVVGEGARCHRHHITPISLGGLDTAENKIRLTPREHWFAHALLVRCYASGSIERFKMLCAARRLNFDGKFFTSRRYAVYENEHNEYMRLRMSGERNPNFGGALQTSASRAKMRKPRADSSNMGKWVRSDSYRDTKSSQQKVDSFFIDSNPMKDPAMRNKVRQSKLGLRAHYNTEFPGVKRMFRLGQAPEGWRLP